jgi:radical SAM superfamily enzyme YgiQ (UPF0313 family)
MIDFYSPVLEKNIPSSVYFGGGSSSIMTAEIMKDIFSKIRNFDKIKDKTFECDINLLTKEKIQLLIDYGFTNVSFGVQTFNERILKKNNRINKDIGKIREMVNLFQNHNILVSCDLMIFIDNEDASDLNELVIDLKKMTNIVKPNQICVYPNTYTIDRVLRDNGEDEAIKLVFELEKTLLRNLPSFNNYVLYDKNKLCNKDEIRKSMYYNYHLHRTNEDKDKFLDKYNATSYPDHSEKQVLLGIGAYENHCSYSHIRRDFYFIEHNKNNDYDNTFYTQVI